MSSGARRASIDLNADLGEGMGTDADLLGVVTSANVACGSHAGSDATMRATVAAALAAGVAIGAHPSYDDREGFGRTPQDPPTTALVDHVAAQIHTLRGHAEAAGARVTYVKPHGALYNTIVHDERQAAAVVTAITEVSTDLALLCLPGAAVGRLAEAAGLRVVHEAFADRAYTAAGTLVARTEPGAVITDVDAVVARVLSLVETGAVASIDSAPVRLSAATLCVHGDSPGAVALARAIADGLREAGVALQAFAP